MTKPDWKAIVRTVAPGIATALGGPLAGLAVQTVSNALLGKPDGSPAEVEAAVMGASPDALLKLKQADNDFKLAIERLGVDLEKIAAEDRGSARSMQVATRSKVPGILAMAVTVGFFTILIGLLMRWMVATDNNALLILLGALSAAWGAIVNFYYGSSADSHRKTEIMSQGGEK